MKVLKTIWKPIRTVLAGAVVGVANVIPGVSGGTMAVIVGVFDRMVEALGLKNLRKNIGFLILLGIGAGGGILAFSGVIGWLLENYPMPTAALFFGLVLGSIPMIFKRAGGRDFRLLDVLPLAAGVIVMVGFTLLDRAFGEGNGTAATALTWMLVPVLLITCAISTVAMILPGISGSAMLMIFGQYFTVIGAIERLKDVLLGQVPLGEALPQLLILLPAGVGILVGLIFGSRLVDGALRRYPKGTYSVILGLILGSLYYLFPALGWNVQSVVAVVLLIAGTVVSFLFTRKEM